MLTRLLLRRKVCVKFLIGCVIVPYCQKCGKENGEDAKFCESCGASLTSPQPERNREVRAQKPPISHSSMTGTIALVIVLIGGFFFAATVEVFDCPRCNNTPLLKYICTYCGHDGKVTLIQLLMYSMQHDIAGIFYPISHIYSERLACMHCEE